MARPLLLFITALFFVTSCQTELKVSRIEGQQININDSISSNEEIDNYIEPYKERIAQEMDSVLAYAPNNLNKTVGDLNTAIGNMMADAVMELAGPIYEKRTGNSIDMVILNHGGIRSPIDQGEVTTRTAYQLMPFENEVMVAELKGEQIKEIVEFLIAGQTPHPIAGLELVINENNEVVKVWVQGEPINSERTYHVATNDYLYQGGDNMLFFSKALDVTGIDYKLRNLFIDYFRKKDTLAPVIDQRFIRKER